MKTNTFDFDEEQIQDILAREALRQRQHDEWRNANEAQCTDADGVQTMTTGFWGKGEY